MSSGPPTALDLLQGEVHAVVGVEQVDLVDVPPQLEFLALAGPAGRVEAGDDLVAGLGDVGVPGRKFIAGEPMKPAANRLRGCSYSSCGVPTCWITPVRITATRSPRVIASIWSWVT